VAAVKNFLVAAFFLVLTQAAWAADVGEFAPDFTAVDTHGQRHSLSEYQGRYVVLEWTNRNCSYVQNQYVTGNMQNLQLYWTSQGVVWLTVISSAPGRQGYVTAPQENDYVQEIGAAPTAVLLDPTGELGHRYEATTTPEMFIISPGGKLIYHGAFDDRPQVGYDGIPGALNYVAQALEESIAGQRVTTPETRPYGYSVKYDEPLPNLARAHR
jgi:AhpC/TSA family protein